MARSGWSCVVDKREERGTQQGLKTYDFKQFQAHSTTTTKKNCQGTHKNVLFNVGAVKKEEGEHTNSTLYDNWKCTNANKLCG